jgi:hypothetical protein
MSESTIALDTSVIQQLIETATKNQIVAAVEKMINDPVWIDRIEKTIQQTLTQSAISRIQSIDVTSIVNKRVDENTIRNRRVFPGINDQTTQVQLTLMDDHTVVENTFTARQLNIVDGATINHLAVRGSINTDNPAWDELAKRIGDKTLAEINDVWRSQLITGVIDEIKTTGIEFSDVKVNGQAIFMGNTLNPTVTDSRLQSVGTLRELAVAGEASINNTLSVLNKRVGVNTESPEMALSIWDEEVTVNIGKLKSNHAYIGTSRAQGLSLGVNRTPQIEISEDGITTIKKLRIGQHMISYSVDVPGWSGTRGDLVFNASPRDDGVFAWVCTNGFQWKVLKSV